MSFLLSIAFWCPFGSFDEPEFVGLRPKAIAAALLVPAGSAKERPPVGVGGNTTSSVSPSAIHLPLKGKAFGSAAAIALAFPLRGRWISSKSFAILAKDG